MGTCSGSMDKMRDIHRQEEEDGEREGRRSRININRIQKGEKK